MFQEFQRYSAPVFMLKYVIDIARTGQGIPADLVDNVRATSGFEKHFIYSITNLEAASLTSANYCDELLAMIHTHFILHVPSHLRLSVPAVSKQNSVHSICLATYW